MASINLKNVHVEFPIFDSRSRSLKNMALQTAGFKRIGPGEQGVVVVKALHDINFILNDGDRVGLIGRNGSGKSSLLRVLASVYEPTHGTIQLIGKRSSLLNLLSAMDIEASGYENIMLQGLAQGLSLQDIKEQREDIIAFTELGDHINLPVRTYSTGMQLRLAFAIATAKKADILLIDEVIGVGDAEFLIKAKERLDKLMLNAKILVIASHDEHVLRTTCNKLIIMQDGSLAYFGPIEEALNYYHQM